ncbi:MAG: hypothetical protein ACJ74O_00735 [Frankiaceae bacterium]
MNPIASHAIADQRVKDMLDEGACRRLAAQARAATPRAPRSRPRGSWRAAWSPLIVALHRLSLPRRGTLVLHDGHAGTERAQPLPCPCPCRSST